jgi:hypothetical protein
VGLLTTLGALSFLFYSVYGLGPHFDLRPHEALGQTVAGEALKLLGPGGRVILVTRDLALFKNPPVKAQVGSFCQALKKGGGTVGVTNHIKIDPLRLVSVPPGDFFLILKKASEPDVIVSFLGPPVLNPEQVSKLEEKRPKVVALCTGAMPRQVNLKRLFDDKLLHVAVISRTPLAANAPEFGSVQACFDHWYALVTPANLDDLPANASRP